MNSSAAENKHWSGTGKLRGGSTGVWLLATIVRRFGLHAGYAFIALPTAYFTFASPDIASTMAFHRRAFGRVPWWKRRWLVFKHFYSFGVAIVDRLAILAGDRKNFRFEFASEKNLRLALAEKRGVMLLAAHFGNWEAAAQLLQRIDVPITITGFDRETPQIRAILNDASKQTFKLQPLTGSPTDAIALVAALRRGEVVAMLGDRDYGSPSVSIPFFGGTAKFPIGAYVMASIAGAPLMHVFSLREPGRRYCFFGSAPQHPQMPVHHERDAYLKQCAGNFAYELEAMMHRDPFQWYNFFPFWEEDKAAAAQKTLPGKSPLAAQPAPTKS